MTTSTYILIAAFLLMVLLPYFFQRKGLSRTENSFALGRRTYGPFWICCGLSATFIGGAAILNVSSVAYTFGWYALFDVLPVVAALLGSSLIVKRLYGQNRIGVAGLLGHNHRANRIATGMLVGIVYLLISAAQIVALTRVVQPFVDLPFPLLAVILSAFVAAYVIYGGYNSVTLTDAFQFVLMTTFFVLLIGGVMIFTDLPTKGDAVDPKVMPFELIFLLSLPLFFVPISQDLHLRINSARSAAAAQKGILAAAVVYAVFGILAILVGRFMAANGYTPSSPDEVIPLYFQQVLGLWAFLPTIALLAIITSTLDSVSFSSSTAFCYDCLLQLKPQWQRYERILARLTTFGVLTAACLIALFAPRILTLILSALLIYVSVFLPMLLASLLKINNRAYGIFVIIFATIITVVELSGFTFTYRVFAYLSIHVFFISAIAITLGGSKNE